MTPPPQGSDNNLADDLIRNAFGRFATGVTIVTALGSDGRWVGMTASSFNSVSLDPPMILWSAGQQAIEYETYANCKKFAVHVLGESQADLSNRFATAGIDKFDGVDCELSPRKLPVIKGCALCLECETVDSHDAGDHKILVGRVIAVDIGENDKPLLYFGSKYHRIGNKL